MNYWILLFTFLGVNLDFFFMMLFMVKKYNVTKVIIGYLLGIVTLLIASYSIGQILDLFLPEWVLGLLGFLPIYMALHDDDDDDGDKQHRSPILSVFFTYLAVCAGCNLAIFLPVLVGATFVNFLLALLFISILSVVMVIVVKLISDIPVVSKVMEKYGEILMKVCYILIGLYVFWDSGLIEHIIGFF
ncbi:cadmium resistance transporter [Lactobacillaceae bacterium Scapto_B20]